MYWKHHLFNLKKIDGVGPANIFGIKLVHSVSRRYLKSQMLNQNVISSSTDIKNYLIHTLRDKSRENFGIILLNGRNEITSLADKGLMG